MMGLILKALTGSAGPYLAGALGAEGQPAGLITGPRPANLEEKIDIARIEGQVKVNSVKKVAEFVESHPEESVSILRSWLHETG